jgi:hypothetical protein
LYTRRSMNDVTDARVGIILIVAKGYKDGVASGSELPDYADSILMVRRRLNDASLSDDQWSYTFWIPLALSTGRVHC